MFDCIRIINPDAEAQVKGEKMKESRKMSPIEMKAKKNSLEALRKSMQDMMGEKLSGVKKVSVAADSKEGLEKGLDKAKDLLGHEEAEGEMDSSPEHESLESDADRMIEGDGEESMSASKEIAEGEISDEELDAKIKDLLDQKAKRKQS